jgi:hypothetical protein
MSFYLTRFAFWSALLAAAVIGLARLVDPYGYWGGPLIDSINRAKPFAMQHMLPVKHAQYVRVSPRTVLIGNSRVQVGIDPQARIWPAPMRPVYNFGMPGAGFDDSVEAAIAAAAAHRPDTIFAAVEFLDFRVTQGDWHTQRPVPQPIAYRTPFGDLVTMHLSLDALTDSLSALIEQHKTYPATTTAQGFNGLGEYHEIVAAEGHAALFSQRNRENIGRFLTQPKRLSWPERGSNPRWAALERLAAYCKDKRIRLILFTYPYHTDLLMSFDRAGLLPDLIRWRRDLAAFGARTGVPVYDEIGVTPQTSEAVPVKGDTKTQMHWYWEAGHFKASAGDAMVADMLSGHSDRLLSPARADARNRQLRPDLAAYRAISPAAVARFESDFNAAQGKR